jgi:hypothetical protein
MKNKYFNDLTPKEILSETIVYDNGGETYDRYTIFTPDGSVFGMSEDAKGFNQFLGDHSEIEEGDHLGKKLKGVPKAIQNAVLERMEDEEDSYGDGGSIAKGNYQMILSQAKEVKHHANELQNILKNEKDIDAWVVAKMENVSSTLSDITHYLDGKTEYGDGGEVDDDDLIEDDDNEYANGGSLEDIRNKYELNRMMVRSKVAVAIGIDNAMRYLDQDFVVSPYSLLEGAVNKGFIDAQEIDKNLWESALSEAYSIDDMYRDSGQGIGGSDMNAFISSMLNDAGIKIEVVNNRYERVDKKFAKGGEVDMLKEDDFVWNAVGKKLIVNKVTKDEYYLVGFGQISASPFSKNKVHSYLKKGEWSLKAPKFAKGGAVGSNYEIELFWKGLKDDRLVGKYIVSSKTLDNLEEEYAHALSIDVLDESSGKAISYYDLKKKIYAKGKERGFFAEGGETESTIDILMTEEPKVWDKFGFNSGSEIRASKDKTKKYAQELERVFTAKGIKKGSLTKKINEDLTDENYHLLNEFLTRNGYFNSKLTDELLKSYNNPVYSGAYADKESITIEAKAKPNPSGAKKIQRKKLSAKTTYIPNREIEEVDLKSGKKIAGSDIVDGVYKKK